MYLKFSDAYEQYLIYIDSRMKIQSKKELKEKFENKILPYFKDFNIYDIKELDYMYWQNEIEKFDYGNNYKSNLHYLVSGFLNYCVMYHELKYNVAKRVGNFKKKYVVVEKDFYTFWEFIRFIRKVKELNFNLFFKTMYFYGTRPGETMAFRFSDLNENRYLKVNHSISEHFIDGERKLDTPKSMSSVRKWRLSKSFYKKLLKLKDMYIAEYGLKDYDYYIFGGIKPLAPTTINRRKLAACDKAKLRPIELRAYRRSCASLLYHLKVPVKMIKEWLGHSEEQTTLKYYIQIYDSTKKRVNRTLNLVRLFF